MFSYAHFDNQLKAGTTCSVFTLYVCEDGSWDNLLMNIESKTHSCYDNCCFYLKKKNYDKLTDEDFHNHNRSI